MTDIIINDVETTSVVTTTSGDVIVATASSTSVVSTQETATVTVTDPVTNIVEAVTDSVVITETAAVTIITEGIQGPPGPSGLGASLITLEAGENLALGDPVYISANKLYKASCLSANGVEGVVTTAALITQVAEATAIGIIGVPGLVAGATYFLGVGELVTIPPTSGYVVRMGRSINTMYLILNIEEPVLLAA